MTPQSALRLNQIHPSVPRRIVAIIMFLLGSWMVVAGAVAFFLGPTPRAAGVLGENLWALASWLVLSFAAQVRFQVWGGLSLVIAGTGFMVAGVYCFFEWTPKAVKQAVAAMLFLPGLWLVVAFVNAVPDSDFGWRLLAIPLAFLIRSLAYRVARLLERGAIRNSSHPAGPAT